MLSLNSCFYVLNYACPTSSGLTLVVYDGRTDGEYPPAQTPGQASRLHQQPTAGLELPSGWGELYNNKQTKNKQK